MKARTIPAESFTASGGRSCDERVEAGLLLEHVRGGRFRRFLLQSRQARTVGVVVLSNHVADVGDVARHLLRPNRPLAKQTATKRTEIALDSAILDRYAGPYASGTEAFIITREGAFLTIQLPADWGLPKLRLRPESLRDFFAAQLPLRVTFQTDSDGRVTGLLVYPPRGQKAVPATRIRSNK